MAGLRVVVLDHTAKEGGAETALLRLAQRLRRDTDVDVRVLVFADGPLVGRLRSAGVPTAVVALDDAVASASRDDLGRAGLLRTAVSATRHLPRLVGALRRSGADLVVANSLKSAVFAAVAAPLAGRRWVWHLHDRLAPDYLPAPALALMRMLAVVGPRRMVVNSHATLDTLPRAARRRASIAYPGLDDAVFERSAMPSDPPIVGIVGRISPTKGQREFVAAVAAIADRHPAARFHVVGGALFGEDAYAAGVIALAAEEGIADRVEFTGWVADPLDRLARLSVLVHASPVPEPFGQVIAEAMALGVPVIATDAGGVREIVTADDDGVGVLATLVPPGDVAALAGAIDESLSDPAAGIRRAHRAKGFARRFGIDATADAVLDVWRQVAPARASDNL